MAYSDLDSIHVPTAGQRPPASWGAQVNANFDAVYDDVLAKLGQWTNYTPTVLQSVAVSKTVSYARYLKLGRLVVVQCYLVITSSGTANNALTVSLPVTAAQASVPGGGFYWYDASAGLNYGTIGIPLSTTTVGGLLSGSAAVAGQTNAVGWPNQVASGDSLLISMTYEAAS
ncbi:MAG: hypothetical protein IT196_05375 [Acidimicrobiales bacterium]|nr:hypothetical protein [Acidimicrobiales bacterium]